MSHAEANKIACLHCPRARCNRVCVCYDGKPIEAHALAGDCPDGLFTQGGGPVELLGDRLARLAAGLYLDRLAAWWSRLTSRPCGCIGRRRRLNEWHRRLLRRPSRNGS